MGKRNMEFARMHHKVGCSMEMTQIKRKMEGDGGSVDSRKLIEHAVKKAITGLPKAMAVLSQQRHDYSLRTDSLR